MRALFLVLFLATTFCMTVILPSDAAAPETSFTSAVTSGTSPLTVQFIDSSANTPVSWAWSFGDGNTSAEQSPSHTYSAAGSYTVTLTATNAEGSDTLSKSGYITVSGSVTVPVASFVAAPTSGTAPLAVQFADASSNAPVSWAWSFGDGSTSTEKNPSHSFTTAGTYTVTLTAINAGGSHTVSRSSYITVTEAAATPDAAFVAAVTSGSVPLTVQFADSSTNLPASWVWSFGDGNTSTEQNPAHTYTSAGSYTVTLTASNTAGSDTVSEAAYITVADAIPVASFTANLTSGTAPLYVQFNDTSANYPTAWTWSFGDGGTSTEQNPVYEYEDSGTFTVTLTTENSAGSNTTYTSGYVTVTAVSSPVTSFSADVLSGTCPHTVQFTDSSTNTPTAWLWSFGDGHTSTEQNPSHTYTYAGTFTVSLTAYNTGGSRTSSRTDYITTSGPMTTASLTTITTALPVTTVTTVPVTADPEITQQVPAASAPEAGSGAGDLLIPAGIGIAGLGIGAWIVMKWRRDRYNNWDL